VWKLTSHPLIAGVLAGIILLLIGVMARAIFVSDDGASSGVSSVESQPTESPSSLDTERRPDPRNAGGGESEEKKFQPPTTAAPLRDGNSRLTAKRLVANRPVSASLFAENDEDWFVYRAPRVEDAILEVEKGEPAEPEDRYGTNLVNVWDGSESVVYEEAVAAEEGPFVFRQGLSKGARLYVQVHDGCSPGCGRGPYRIVVRTAPPG
jgi:hypothetical protein